MKSGRPSVVQVRYARTEGASPAEAWSLLCEEERERASRFAFERDRSSYVAAHALLRASLSRLAPVAPERWRFRAGAHGRPELDGEQEALDLHFSLSHTTGLAMCVVARGTPVGVDVEAAGRRPSLELAERYFAPAECVELAALPEPEKHARFLEYWTLKEAFLKALGVGLTYPLSRIAFSLPPEGRIRVSLPDDLGESPDDWHFESRLLPEGYRAAVAVKSGGLPCRVLVQETSPTAAAVGG